MDVLRAAATSFLTVVVTITTTGCAIYSDARDKQGQAAKEAWGKVDLAAQLAVPRQNQQTLLDERLKLEDELWSQRRSRLALLLTRGKVSDFQARLKEDAERLIGDKHTLDELNKAQRDRRTAKETYRLATSGARAAGLTIPSCELVLSAKHGAEPERAKALAALRAIVAAAPAPVAAYAQSATEDRSNDCGVLAAGLGTFGGELGTAQEALRTDELALKESRLRAEMVQAEYKQAVAEYQIAAKQFLTEVDSEGDTDVARKKIDAALTKAGDVLNTLKDAQDSFSVKLLSEARLESLDRFLSTYTDVRNGKGSPANASKAAIALALFPDLQKKAQKVLADLQKPNLIPLTLQKGIEKARLDGAQRDIDIVNTRLALRQAHIDALLAQGNAYWQVSGALANAATQRYVSEPVFKGLLPLTAVEAQDRSDAGPVEGKKNLWMAMALYLDAEGTLRADAVKAEHRIVALSYGQAASLAESNLNQWKALIEPSVDLMAVYGASGLKSSDIAAFLNTLTLLWIGVGVN